MSEVGEHAPEAADQHPPRDGGEGYRPDPRRWRILGVSLVIGFMSLLDVTIVNVALPSIRTGLGASPEGVQWVVSGYALAFGLTLVSGGRLGDAFGRRRMMLVGLAGFVLTSAAVGLAPDEATVIAARLAQGMAAGLLTPQNSALIQQLFRGAERGRAFGLFGLVVSISSGTGPIIGGLIIAALGPDLGWRAIFLVNVPIGAVALVAVARLIPRRERPERTHPRRRWDGVRELDLGGALLLGGSVLCVLLPLVQLMDGPSPLLLVLLGAPLLAAAFVRWEHRVVRTGRPPLLDVTLLRQVPGYASGIALGSIYFTGFSGVFLVLSVFLQDGLGLTPLEAGLTLTPFAVGSAVTAPIAGRLVSRIGRRITVAALLVTGAGIAAVAVAATVSDASHVAWVIAPFLLLAGLGGGGVISPNITLTLADVPPRMGGAAGGALQTGQRIGSALGAAMMVTVYQVTLASSDAQRAVQVALLTALAVIACSLVLALRDLRLDAVRHLG